MSSNWHCIHDAWRHSRKEISRFEVDNHPLNFPALNVDKTPSGSSSRSSSVIALDPLSIAFDGIDPLSQFALESEQNKDKEPPKNFPAGKSESESNGHRRPKTVGNLVHMDSWSSRRAAILNKYTTTERLSIVTSFLTGGETIKSQVSMAEKAKHRLEQLDDFEDGSVKQLDVSQQEYVQRIEQLNAELVYAWNNDHRVNSLKIAIQCSKLLADTSVLRFYPSQFVLITDVLDMFGRLVYDRLHQKANVKSGTSVDSLLPENFTPEMVPEQTKETCQNWFYKIASIRELLPRFYVEVAILRCYNFLDRNEINRALVRLTGICRGIGDPLVATYARCYLSRVGLTLSTEYRYLLENVNDMLLIYHTSFNNGLRAELTRQKIDLHSYLWLYVPAMNWILQGLAATAPYTVLEDVFRRCCEKKNCALLLHCLMASFKADFVAKFSVDVMNTILLSASVEDITKFLLMRQLGGILAEKEISTEDRFVIIDAALKFVTSLRDPKDYMVCLEAWAEFTAKHFPLKQINFIMNDILSHMTPDREFERHYPELQNVVERIVANVSDFEGLMTMNNFLPVIDLFQKDSVKLEVCKSIMSVFRTKVEATTSDPVLINNLMFLCRILNDSVNALTLDDERRQISLLVSNFIKQVDYGKDFEAQLAFYAEARAAFLNLDAVYSTLVTSVVGLMCRMRSYLRASGHTKKTISFARACAAFCFITIPSIQSVASQMDLYYLAGSAALINGCLGQADACFVAAINLILDLTPQVEVDGTVRFIDQFLLSYIPRLLTVLVLVPDSPDLGMLYLPNLVQERVTQTIFENKGTLATIYLHLLDFYITITADTYPHQLPDVISNDRLYGSDPKFIAEVEGTCNQLVEWILEQLQLLGEIGQLKTQATLALELFQRIVARSDVSEEKQFTLAVNLWNLALKNRTLLADPQLPNRIVGNIQERVRQYEGMIVVPGFVMGLAKMVQRLQKKL